MTTKARMSRLAFFLTSVTLSVFLHRTSFAFDGCQVADINGDGVVDKKDLQAVESALGMPSKRKDVDGSGMVDHADIAMVWSYRNACPGYCLADLDGDFFVGTSDRQFLEAFYGLDCQGDLNRDGQICPRDTEVMKAYLGSPPPLSQSAARADLNHDGAVDLVDLDLLSALHMTYCGPDINRDSKVDVNDLGYLHAAWGPCPGTAPLRLKGDPKDTCVEIDP